MVDKLNLLVPPPIVAFVSCLAMWGIASTFPGTTVSFPFQSLFAYTLIGVGAVFDLVSIIAFRKVKTTVTPLSPEKATHLVVTGLYRFTRNPMYLGLLLILSGVAVLLGSPLNVAILVIFVAYITAFQINPEEVRLDHRDRGMPLEQEGDELVDRSGRPSGWPLWHLVGEPLEAAAPDAHPSAGSGGGDPQDVGRVDRRIGALCRDLPPMRDVGAGLHVLARDLPEGRRERGRHAGGIQIGRHRLHRLRGQDPRGQRKEVAFVDLRRRGAEAVDLEPRDQVLDRAAQLDRIG